VARGHSLADAYTLIPSLRICSFDIFDTFLLRRCTDPTGVYERTAAALSGGGRGFPTESFVQHRIQAEAKARRASAEQRGSVEIHIEDVYAQFPLRLFGFTPADIATLAEAEFSAELDLCIVNPEMAALYAAMREAGVRVGFISDTYWNADRIARLLTSRRNDLAWDFLYVSGDSGSGKAEKLFQHYLAREAIDPAVALHIGDNEDADVKGAARAAIRALHYPQAPPALRSAFQSETFAVRTFRASPHQSIRLDDGLRATRRLIAKRLAARGGDEKHGAPEGHARDYGQNVLGPLMAGFDRFIRQRVDAIPADGGSKRAVAYLGRDGLLAFRIAQQRGDTAACYLEINRRVALLAAADTAEPLCGLFKTIPAIDAARAKDILKFGAARIDRFFQRHGRPTMPGRQFAAALPNIFDARAIAENAARIRCELLAYLRQTISGFDACTDLVLIDLGYSATVQKALRRVFDLEGLHIRLHGLYLLTVDDALNEIDGGDTATGYLSDLVMTPHAKRALLRNIAALEQMCSSPDGSVRAYRDGAVLHEADPRPAEHRALCAAIQSGALDFTGEWPKAAASCGIDPFGDRPAAAAWSAALLARMLLLPSPDELSLLSPLMHDVNLGTQTLIPLVDAGHVTTAGIAGGLGGAVVAPEPPMWLAGSFSQHSKLHGIMYAMFGAGLLPAAMLADHKIGQADAALISGETARPTRLGLYRTATGRIRVQVPIAATMNVSTVAIAIGQIAARGRVTGATVQGGKDVAAALAAGPATMLPPGSLAFIGTSHDGNVFSGADPQASYLAVTVPASRHPVSVFSVEIDMADPAATLPPRNQSAAA
jgi:FMN phosphatase YigB (HAD superfamily)